MKERENIEKVVNQESSKENNKYKNDDRSYIEILYHTIDNAVGGDNPSQYFILTFPAQIINPKDYEYDMHNNAPKGPVVEANESQLADKLFGHCQNDFGEGLNNNQTLQSVYLKLYNEYEEVNKKWAELQNNVKGQIEEKNKNKGAEDNKKAEDEYLRLYETTLQAELTALNEKYSKELSVFSPTDIDILEGMLDSGRGSELENAKRIMDNIVKKSLNDEEIYPVNFPPSNWYKYLMDNIILQINSLGSPDKLGMELAQLYVEKDIIIKKLISMKSLIKEGLEDIEEINTDIENAQNDIDDNYKDLFSGISENVSSIIKGIVNIVPALISFGSIKAIFDKIGAKVNNEDVNTFIENIKNNSDKIFNAQNTINKKTQELANKYLEKLSALQQDTYKELVNDIQVDLDSINEKISDKQSKLQLSSALTSSENETDTESANSYAPPQGFTQILIDVEGSCATSDKMSNSSSIVSSEKSWCLFGSSSSNSAEANSHIEEELKSDGSKIQIGMNIIKIGITREWFNPGIFVLTKNMYNISNTKISEISSDGKSCHTSSKEFIEQIHNSKDRYILPCFPAAMVIARDVVLKYSTTSSNSSYVINAMHEELSKGHSVFGFGKTESSVKDNDKSHNSSQMSSQSITIKFNSPQILGYYMEITPPDQSEMMDDK